MTFCASDSPPGPLPIACPYSQRILGLGWGYSPKSCIWETLEYIVEMTSTTSALRSSS